MSFSAGGDLGVVARRLIPARAEKTKNKMLGIQKRNSTY